MKMRCDEPESVLNGIFYGDWTGQEQEVLPLWFDHCLKAQTIIDIGAHVGHFTLVAGLANPLAKIHSFEPMPKVAKLLRRNLQMNQVTAEVHELALSREPGRAAFYATAVGIPSASSLCKEYLERNPVEKEEIEVEVSTLDIEVPAGAGVVLMKIDTETTEPDVLAGATKLLQSRPTIFVEVLSEHETGPQLHAVLDAAGYRFTPYLLTARGPVPRERIEGDAQWRNYLLVPKE